MIVGGETTRLGTRPIDIIYMGQNAKQYSTFQSKVKSTNDGRVMKAASMHDIAKDADRLYGGEIPETLKKKLDKYDKATENISPSKTKILYNIQ